MEYTSLALKLQRHFRGLWLFDLWYPHRRGVKEGRWQERRKTAERKKQTCEVNTGAKREKKDILSFFSLFPAVFKKAAQRQALSTSVVSSTQSLANEFDKFQAKSKLAIEDYWSIWRNRSGWLSTLMPSEYKDQAVSYRRLPQGSATWILSREDYSKLVTQAVKEWRQWPADALKNRWTLWKSWRTWRSSLVRWTSKCQVTSGDSEDVAGSIDQLAGHMPWRSQQRGRCHGFAGSVPPADIVLQIADAGSRIETDVPEVADGLQMGLSENRVYSCIFPMK